MLVAELFPSWLKEMRRSGISEHSNVAGEPGDILRFTRCLLFSAALHTQSTQTTEKSTNSGKEQNLLRPHTFLNFREWRKYPKLCKGVFSEQEILKRICITGAGLPFGAPHPNSKTESRGKVQYEYSRFETKLERIRELFRVDDLEALNGFEPCELEWLAIFLSVDESSVPYTTIESYEKAEHIPPSFEDDSSSISDNEITASLQGEEELKPCGITLNNLHIQLGIEIPDSESTELRSGTVSSFPVIRTALRQCFLNNRSIYEISIHIDNTLALCIGDQYAFMISKESDMETWIVAGCEILALGVEKYGRLASNLSKSELPAERKRLLYQLTCEAPEFSNFDQRMTFLGCSMEHLRSSLAKWVEHHPSENSTVWTPKIPISEVFKFRTSESLSQCVHPWMLNAKIGHRYGQMRLLWELQNHFHRSLPEEGVSPESPVAMILCILSFPAVEVKPAYSSTEITDEGAVATNRDCQCNVSFDLQQKVDVIISIPLGPQNIYVEVSLQCDNKSNLNASVSIGYNCDEEGVFQWEK